MNLSSDWSKLMNEEKKKNRELTVTGSSPIIKPEATFKQITGWNLERRTPNSNAPAIWNWKICEFQSQG
jgi:hypothetical protein